jgi:hypothetical protein
MNRVAGRRNCSETLRMDFAMRWVTPLCCRGWGSTGDGAYDRRRDGESDSGRINKTKVRFVDAMIMASTKSVIVLVPKKACKMSPFS